MKSAFQISKICIKINIFFRIKKLYRLFFYIILLNQVSTNFNNVQNKKFFMKLLKKLSKTAIRCHPKLKMRHKEAMVRGIIIF